MPRKDLKKVDVRIIFLGQPRFITGRWNIENRFHCMILVERRNEKRIDVMKFLNRVLDMKITEFQCEVEQWAQSSLGITWSLYKQNTGGW